MAPGIPEIAMKYGIRDPTVIALTLSIFLLSFAFGVSIKYLPHNPAIQLAYSPWSVFSPLF